MTVFDEPFTTAYRWHVPDPVTFQESLRFLIEQGNGSRPSAAATITTASPTGTRPSPTAPFPAAAQRQRADKLGRRAANVAAGGKHRAKAK